MVETKPRDKADKELYPIEVVDEDLTRCKVHYVGYNHSYDEWKDKEIIDISPEVTGGEIQRFSLYHELASRIKTAAGSSLQWYELTCPLTE